VLLLPRLLTATGPLVALSLMISSRASADDELEVRVGGNPVDRHSTRDAAAASTVLRRGDLESPGADAAYELARVPGVQVQRSGGGSDLATASIRGTTSAQTPVYLAGIRLNDDLSGTADLSTVPLWMLDRVEIYRGHAPFGLEATGIGGAILFEPRIARGPELRGGFTAGSFGNRSVYGAAGEGSSRSSALFALRRESSNNDYRYLDNSGTAYTTADDRWVTRRNAQQATTDAWAIGRVTLSNSSQWILISNVFERSQGITGLLAIPAEHADARISRELFGISSRTSLLCGLAERCEFTSATTFQRAAVSLDDPAYELGLGSLRLDSHSNRVSQRFEIRWPLGGAIDLGTLLSGGAETLDIARPAAASLDATRHSGAIGVGPDWSILPGMRLLGNARFDSESTRASGQMRSETHATGRLGAAIEPFAGLTFMANGGLYARTPTLGELYGTSAFVVGNPLLQAERGTNRDVGVRYRSRASAVSWALEVFAFRQNIDKLVGWQRSSFGQIKPYNVGKARLEGIETAMGLEFWSILHVDSAITLIEPRDVSPSRTLKNDFIPFRSRLVVDSTVEVHTRTAPETLGLSRASAFVRSSHRGSRYQDPAGLIIIPHSTTFDAGFGLTLARIPVTLRTTVYNVFDQSVFDIVGYPLPPRTVVFGAELAWE
jgi:vitamin B12 transporter